jgi:autotransporter-associated beta strand protein
MKDDSAMKFTWLIACATVVCSLTVGSANAAVKYWDLDGATPGSGGIGTFGDWDSALTPNWSTSAAGDTAPDVWNPGDEVVFNAGSEPFDTTVVLRGDNPGGFPINPAAMTIENGRVLLQLGGTSGNTQMQIGAAPMRINQGGTLQFATNLVLIAQPGHVLTLDGGTVRNTVVGIASGVYPGTNTRIELTSNGGIIDTPNGGFVGDVDDVNGAYSIMTYVSPIAMSAGTTSATLRKTGFGEFRGINNYNFTRLEVEQGLYRISSAGGGETGFGAATGTVTTTGGAVENTTNGTALGTSVALTGANASPVTRSFVLGNTGGTPDTMFVMNGSWTINSPISGPGGLMLNGWARNDGSQGTGTTTIIGSQTPVLLLAGNSTYGGNTTINFGTLGAAGGSAIPDTSRVAFSTRTTWGNASIGGPTTDFNTAILRVDASETVGSISGGNALRGVVNINGAAVVLSTGADNTSSTFDGVIQGAGGLTKVGTGTFTMNGANTYTGDTLVTGGTLSTSTLSLADAADVYLNTGSILNLNFAGTDTIDSLFINNVAAAIGTWGGTGSGAANISPLITGTGLLQVTTAAMPVDDADFDGDGDIDGADFLTWQRNLGATGTGTLATGDANGDTNVNAADLAVWQTQFATATPVAGSVPEPTCVVMLGSALAALAAVRRRK